MAKKTSPQRHAFNEILDMSSGAQWLKVDLHIHTPASDIDPKYDDITPQDVVDAALEKELDLIAITDHNTVDWCEKVSGAAKGTDLTVLHGVEVSTRQGHLLVIFDVDTPTHTMQDFLVSIGIRKEYQGDLHFSTPKGIMEVADAASDWNGIAIAAHADGSKGFLEIVAISQERHRVYSHQNLWAMELIDASKRTQFQSGKYYPSSRKMTCLQFSDSHKLREDMASRHTYLKMGERNLNGVKLALLDPDIRVRFPDDKSLTPDCTILGLWVTGEFLDGQKMRFNDGVNCLIGNTGAGKSLTIELIRFALDQTPIVEKIHQETDSLLANQLGSQGRVHILLSKGESKYLVERMWDDNPSQPFVQRINEDGSLHQVNISSIQEFFPAKCFSQSEIIEFARNPSARLSLMDDLIDISNETSAINETKNELRANAESTLSTERERDLLQDQVARRATLVEELARIDQVLPRARINEQNLWHTDRLAFSTIRGQIDKLPDAIDQAESNLILKVQPPPQFDDLPSKSEWNALTLLLKSWNEHVEAVKNTLQEQLDILSSSYNNLHQNWLQSFNAKEEEFKTSLESLDVEGAGFTALASHRRGIQGEIDALTQKEEELTQSVIPRLENFHRERETLLDALQNNRKAITKKRSDKAEELKNKLDHKIRIKIHPRQETTLYKKKLKEISIGAHVYEYEIDGLIECNPIPLVKALLNDDFQILSDKTGVSAHKIERLKEVIVERNKFTQLYNLQLTDIDDTTRIQLEVQSGDYKSLEELSHGQKCEVVLLIAQAEGSMPLLVDQPEDALHAPSIESGIVKTLRSQRNSRQCIFATRNANILVSADSDQIIALDSDANQGRVSSTGSLDRYDHNKLVLYHVEGGEEAFRRRRNLYELRHSSE